MTAPVRAPAGSEAVPLPPLASPRARIAWWELRHARLRLALVENEIAWAAEALMAGYMPPEIALSILDEAMNDIAGVRP